MAFLRNSTVNRINVHYGIHAFAQGAGGIFLLVFLLKAGLSVPTTLLACSSDQLVPLAQMEDLSRRLPRLAGFHVIRSMYGHDAFLKEPAQISRALRRFLDEGAHE